MINSLESAGQFYSTVEIIRTERDWRRIRDHWDALFGISPAASPPLRFEWLWEWWRVYGQVYGKGGLHIITVWKHSDLVGVLPLYLQIHGRILKRRMLRFISTGESEFEEVCPDRLDLLYAEGEERYCLDAIETALSAPGNTSWDIMNLSYISEHSPLHRWRNHWIRGQQIALRSAGVSPYANLRGGFESYLDRLSANGRRKARQTLREVENSGAEFVVASSGSAVDGLFSDLVRLHQDRWTGVGKPGCFAARRFAHFHGALARAWVSSGKAVLAGVFVKGEPLAIIYGFRVRDRFDFYQSGAKLQTSTPIRSPGIAAHLLLMKHLADEGIAEYDFLRGEHFYKRQLSTDELRQYHVAVIPPTIWNAVRAACERIGHSSKRRCKSIRRNLPFPTLAVLNGDSLSLENLCLLDATWLVM